MLKNIYKYFPTLAAATIFIAIILGEIIFKSAFAYSYLEDAISDIGVYNKTISDLVFNIGMILAGCLILLSTRIVKSRFIIVFALYGVSVVGIGLFPSSISVVHGISAIGSFALGGIFAVLYGIENKKSHRGLFSLVLGIMVLVLLVTFPLTSPVLGYGLAERFIVYTLNFWLLFFNLFKKK
jgi:hypothetical membrane protein